VGHNSHETGAPSGSMHWKLFADLAEIAGDNEIAVEVTTDDPTVADALGGLLKATPELEARIYAEDGTLESHLNLLKNGETLEDGLTTPVAAGDELALFPPVSGG